MDRKESQDLVQGLVDLVLELTAIGDAVRSYRKDCSNLTRRIKVLAPLFEELRETGCSLPAAAVSPFRAIHTALCSAKDLLQECRDGSQFVMILDREKTSSRFRELTADLSRALDSLPLETLDISDEVHEQVVFVHAQLKKAKGRVDSQDEQLFQAVNTLLTCEADGIDGDHAALEKVAEKLQLRKETSWKQELKALEGRKGAVASRSEEQRMDHMINVLKQIQVEQEKAHKASSSKGRDRSPREGAPLPPDDVKSLISLELVNDPVTVFTASSKGRDRSPRKGAPVPPDDFKCPISLELMNDPVIVATGQTYERVCIQKWLDNGHKTCPKTQQQLSHLALTPNYVLRSLIAQWCETNGLDVPKSSNGRNGKHNGIITGLSTSSGEEIQVGPLLLKLASDQVEVQRGAAGELRLLAKASPENRLCIAESGAIPILVSLLSTPDLKTQEHAVTALLNLSIHESNKRAIVSAGAIDPIVEVLKHGSMEARENSAATLFSLSAVDEHKVTIGNSGAIPALVVLLQEGQSRGKKDAATALFTLSIYQGNKAKAVRTGIVPPLMDLLVDTSLGMVDEALAILAVLATHQEGRLAIGRTNVIPILVDLIRNGSPRNKENGASVLLALCTSNSNHATTARNLGATEPLNELLHSGTNRAKRKALELLAHLSEHDSVFIGTGRTR
ncbi:unnamed protein product [Calypogeia fissa]